MLWFHYLLTSSPGPPYVHPLGELRAVVGKPFSVICPAAGYPLEKVTWTKGELLNISGCKFNESYLIFRGSRCLVYKFKSQEASPCPSQ